MGTSGTNTGTQKSCDFADLAIAAAFGLAVAVTVLFLGVMPLIRSYAGSRDFVVYWATGQQLAHHANPYDPNAMGMIEHAAGLTLKGSYFMRNPPWALWLMLPLGFVDARLAALPWSLLMAAVLIVCVRMLGTMFGRPRSHIELLGYAFPPAVICILEGQTSLFLLLGLVLFLKLHSTRPFAAGAALWLCTLKPHLFLPFAVVLLAWIVMKRRYAILAGAAAAMAAACALTACIDPAAWSQYMEWAHASGIAHEFIPCLGVVLRDAIDPSREWIAFLPACVACLWALSYFWPRRHEWDWLEHGSLLMLVSVLVAPYCWFWDQPLVLPALLYAACRTTSRKVLAGLALLFLLLELQPLWSIGGTRSALYLWPAPAWLLWYLAARRSTPLPAFSAAPEYAVSSALD